LVLDFLSDELLTRDLQGVNRVKDSGAGLPKTKGILDNMFGIGLCKNGSDEGIGGQIDPNK